MDIACLKLKRTMLLKTIINYTMIRIMMFCILLIDDKPTSKYLILLFNQVNKTANYKTKIMLIIIR